MHRSCAVASVKTVPTDPVETLYFRACTGNALCTFSGKIQMSRPLSISQVRTRLPVPTRSNTKHTRTHPMRPFLFVHTVRLIHDPNRLLYLAFGGLCTVKPPFQSSADTPVIGSTFCPCDSISMMDPFKNVLLASRVVRSRPRVTTYLEIFIALFLVFLVHGVRWRSCEIPREAEENSASTDTYHCVPEDRPVLARRWKGTWAVWSESNPVG